MSEKKTATAMNNELRNATFDRVMEKFIDDDAVQTDSTSFDIPVIREDGAELFVTVKVTLHKEDYDQQEKIDALTDKYNEQAKRAAVKAEKDRIAAEKKAEREAKKTAAK